MIAMVFHQSYVTQYHSLFTSKVSNTQSACYGPQGRFVQPAMRCGNFEIM